MVYPHEHLVLRFQGHFGTSSSALDKWSAGVRFGFPGKGTLYDAAKLQTFVNSAKTAATTFHQAAAATVGSDCFLDQVTGAMVGVDGKYVPSGQLTVISPTTAVPGGSSNTHSWDTALVTSLRTAIPRGRGSNGRVYWPATGAAIQDGTGRLSSGAVTSRLNLFKTFLDSLNSAANTYDAGMKAIVASNVGGGLIAVVTSIRADTRLDSIERRENDQLPVWSTATLA